MSNVYSYMLKNLDFFNIFVRYVKEKSFCLTYMNEVLKKAKCDRVTDIL